MSGEIPDGKCPGGNVREERSGGNDLGEKSGEGGK